MGKKRKNTGNRHGLQVVTLCISTALVLILLGLVLFTASTAQNLSSYMKENLLAATARRFFYFPRLTPPHPFVTAAEMGEDWEKNSNFAL